MITEPDDNLIKNGNRQEGTRQLGNKNKQFKNVTADQLNIINTISLSNNHFDNSLTGRHSYNKKSKEQKDINNKDTFKERENLFNLFNVSDTTQQNSMIGQLLSPDLHEESDSSSTIKARKGGGSDVDDSYAIANPKRNRDYHNFFKEIPHDEYLINDYGCALQREILAHGRIYVSLNYVCFHANIFGWITKVVIPFSDIIVIEKKMTAFVIPNAILITTNKSKYFFASFISRDTAYELFTKLWKGSNWSSESDYNSDDNQKYLQNGHQKDNTDSSQSSDSEARSIRLLKDTKSSLPHHNNNKAERIVTKPPTNLREDNETHHEMICDCLKNKQHFNRIVLDTKFKGSVEKIYNLLYTSGFIAEFLTDLENNDDINIGEWVEDDGKLIRQASYTKQLHNPTGPNTTKCYLKDEVLHRDFDKYVTIMTSAETPNIPSGSTVKTRTCIMWSGSNQTRVIVTGTVEFSKFTTLKGSIEKASFEGQLAHYKAIETAVREYISQNPSEFDHENTSTKSTTSILDKEGKHEEENNDNFNSSIKQKFIMKKNDITNYFQKVTTTISTLTNIMNVIELRVPNIETIVLIAFILTLIFNVYVGIGLKDIKLKMESIEKLSGSKEVENESGKVRIKVVNGYILNEGLNELRRQQLSSILDESIWDIYNEKPNKRRS